MEPEKVQLLVITVSLVFLILLVVLFVIFFYFQKKKTAYLIERMEAELHFQNELVQTRIEIKDQTLSEISKELHDNIGQILSVAIMQVNIYSKDVEKITINELDDLKGVLAKSLDEIRVLSKIINRDNFSNFNFEEAIALDFERIRKLKNIQCQLEIVGEIPKINKEHELIIYRIFQEAVHNVLRHSHSEVIVMQMHCSDDYLTINLADQGIGFDVKSVSGGLGLHNMQLRAKLIGATFTINSTSKGSSITLKYPLIRDHEE